MWGVPCLEERTFLQSSRGALNIRHEMVLLIKKGKKGGFVSSESVIANKGRENHTKVK
jgi:hypothetical protein